MASKRNNRNRSNKRRTHPEPSRRGAAKGHGESYETDFDTAAQDLEHAHDSLQARDPRPFLHVVSAFVAIGRNRADELPSMAVKLNELHVEGTLMANALIAGVAQLGATADDRMHAQSLVNDMTTAEKQAIPEWLVNLRDTTIARAGISSDVWWEGSSRFLQLDLGGYPVTLSSSFNHVDGYTPSVRAFDMTWDQAMAKFASNHAKCDVIEEAAPALIALQLATGLEYKNGLDLVEPCEADSWVRDLPDDSPWADVELLLEWAIRLAGPIDRSSCDEAFVELRRRFDPDFEDLRDSVDEIAAIFRSSRFGQAAIAAGVDGHENLEDLIWFGVSNGHGRPFCWGKWRVVKFLTHWSHQSMLQTPDQIVRLPELLGYWIHYAHERQGLHESDSQPVLYELAELTPIFRSQLDGRIAAVFALLDDLGISDELIESELA